MVLPAGLSVCTNTALVWSSPVEALAGPAIRAVAASARPPTPARRVVVLMSCVSSGERCSDDGLAAGRPRGPSRGAAGGRAVFAARQKNRWGPQPGAGGGPGYPPRPVTASGASGPRAPRGKNPPPPRPP